MAYDIRDVIARVSAIDPNVIFKSTDAFPNSDPNSNKTDGKQFKIDVELGLIDAVSIGKDSANAHHYIRTR